MKTIGIVLTVILTMTTLTGSADAFTGTSSNTVCLTGYLEVQVGCATGFISHRVQACDNAGCWVQLIWDIDVNPMVCGEFHEMQPCGELTGKTGRAEDPYVYYPFGTHTVGDMVWVTDGAGTGRYSSGKPVNHTFVLSKTSAATPSMGLYLLPEVVEMLDQAGEIAVLAKNIVMDATPPPGSNPPPRVFVLP